jgi:hypothetical protein
MPSIAKVRSNNPKDSIGPYLTQTFQKLSPQELNRLYVTAQFLKVHTIKRAIAAFLGAKVYIGEAKGDL